MKRWLLLAGFVAGWLVSVASAQQWGVYMPRERDFRVLMPAPPVRSVTKEGSVQYRADFGRLEYYVLRHDPRRLADVHSVREDLVKRMSSGERTARPLGEDESDLQPNEFVFKVGTLSMHRVFTDGGQYYELVVKTADEDYGLDRQLARDYFASFQVARGARFTGFMAIPALDICNGRAHGMARMLCQYVVCMQPGYESQPACRALPGFRHN